MNTRIKNALLILAASFSLIFTPILAHAAELKIGYADIAHIFDSYNKTKEQNKILTDQSNKSKEERDKMVMQIRKMKEEMDVLSESARDKRQAEIDERIKQLQEYDQKTSIDLKQEQDKMMRDLFKDIDSVVEKYAQQNGYSIILNSRVLLYSQKQYDVTDEILKILNSKTKK